MFNMTFATWLDKELEKRGWNKSELARRANVGQSSISLIYSEKRNPGVEICLAIAKALDLPPEEVYRAAGLLPKKDPHSVLEEKALYIINSMETEAYQRRALSLLEYLKQEEEKELRNAPSKPTPHPSESG